jgi:hypothetical protein
VVENGVTARAADEEAMVKMEQRKTEGEECNGAPSYHIGGAKVGKPNPSQASNSKLSVVNWRMERRL